MFQANVFARRCDGAQVNDPGGFTAIESAAGKILRDRFAPWHQRRIKFFANEHLALGLQPVRAEDALNLRDAWAFDLKMRVAPELFCFRIAQPGVTDAGAAGETDSAIHNHKLAMVTEINAIEQVQPRL